MAKSETIFLTRYPARTEVETLTMPSYGKEQLGKMAKKADSITLSKKEFNGIVKEILEPGCLGNLDDEVTIENRADECFKCPAFDRCHKITMLNRIWQISRNLDLLLENGFANGSLKPYLEMEKWAKTCRERARKDK